MSLTIEYSTHQIEELLLKTAPKGKNVWEKKLYIF